MYLIPVSRDKETFFVIKYELQIINSKKALPKYKSLVSKYPVPIIDKKDMELIDSMVKEAHHKQHMANNNIRMSIQMVEEEIEKWNN